jgi:hypothetical protein
MSESFWRNSIHATSVSGGPGPRLAYEVYVKHGTVK